MKLYSIDSWMEIELVNDSVEFDVIVEFELSRYYPQTLTEPEEPSEITITSITENGDEWIEYADDQTIERLKEEAGDYLTSIAEDDRS